MKIQQHCFITLYISSLFVFLTNVSFARKLFQVGNQNKWKTMYFLFDTIF